MEGGVEGSGAFVSGGVSAGSVRAGRLVGQVGVGSEGGGGVVAVGVRFAFAGGLPLGFVLARAVRVPVVTAAQLQAAHFIAGAAAERGAGTGGRWLGCLVAGWSLDASDVGVCLLGLGLGRALGLGAGI